MKFRYSDEHLDFIRSNYPVMTIKVLAECFNIKFKLNKSTTQIFAAAKRHKMNSGRTGRFEKGSISWNQGTKGIMKPNSGNFKKGVTPPNLKPFGHERICSKDGYVLIKVDQPNPHTGFKGRYVHKHRYIWEQAYGQIPEGKVVTFKDDNKRNFELSNLELIDRWMLVRFNKNKLSQAPVEIKPVLRTLLKLEASVGRVGSNI